MKQYYELHITMQEPPERREHIAGLVEKQGWTFSAIEGDPILGAGVKMYATQHLNPRHVTAEQAQGVVDFQAKVLEGYGANVIRRKVEFVHYDARKGRDF